MSNTGHKWITKTTIPRLRNPIRYKVRIYYGAKENYVGLFESLDTAIQMRDWYMRAHGIDKDSLKRYNRKKNGIKT